MPQRRRGYTGEHERAIAKKARRERERNSNENKQQAAQIKGLQNKLSRQSKTASTQAAPPPKPADDMVIKQRPVKDTDKRSEAKEKAQAYKGSTFSQKYGEQDGAVGIGDFMRNQSPGSKKHAKDGQNPDSLQSKQRGMDMSKYQFNAGG